MGLLSFLSNAKKKVVERVGIDQIKKEKATNDISITEVEEKTNKQEKIRLCFVSLQEFNGVNENDKKLEIAYGASCVYKAPVGMSLEDIYKTVSYVSRLNNERYRIDPITEISVQCAGVDLENFGFEKQKKADAHFSHTHMFSDFDPNAESVKVETKNIVKTDIEGVHDLMTVDGDIFLFAMSDLATKNCAWFRLRSRFEDIEQIYNKLGISINKNGVEKSSVKESE